MPQVDLETLVSSVCAGGSDRKIACETLADDPPGRPPTTRPEPLSIPPADLPPESYFLSKKAEIDWLNQNAFYERKESQKGNSASNSTNLNPNLNTGSNRVSLKSKSSIIGLPKPQKTCFNEAKNRRQHCRIANARLFPKRVGSKGKKDHPLSEPSSPKVSCMGRVRSKRDRSRRIHRQKSGRSSSVGGKPVRVKKPGLFSSIKAMFRTRRCKDVSARGIRATPMESRSGDIRLRLPPDDVDAIRASDSPPQRRKSTGSRKSFENESGLTGLGGMKRFASGRRADLAVDV